MQTLHSHFSTSHRNNLCSLSKYIKKTVDLFKEICGLWIPFNKALYCGFRKGPVTYFCATCLAASTFHFPVAESRQIGLLSAYRYLRTFLTNTLKMIYVYCLHMTPITFKSRPFFKNIVSVLAVRRTQRPPQPKV